MTAAWKSITIFARMRSGYLFWAERVWLFSDTPAGADASERLYSLIETAKANGLEPYAYLCHIFAELPKAKTHTR